MCDKDATKSRKGGASKCLKELVDLIGIEPMTSSMPWKRAPSCATGPLSGKDLFILADRRAFVNAAARTRIT